MADIDSSRLSETDEEAEYKFNKYAEKDPYPKINASLLNSADILAYVKATSLIHPFHTECLKGASYNVKIRGEVIYWDDKGEEKSVILDEEGKYFDLHSNSIAFVTLEPIFRIPCYLALRFNLKIAHIYKGLLLGTGPLVDPGFVGKLSIPLHNLTSNTYHFSTNDELITMEFTKMSANKRWNEDAPDISESYIINDIPKNRTVREYIRKALGRDCPFRVISSIPEAMLQSQKKVENSEKAVEEVKKIVKNQAEKTEKETKIHTTVSIIAVCTLVISCIAFSLTAFINANSRYDELINKFNSTVTTYERKIEELQNRIDNLINLTTDHKLDQQPAETPLEKTGD